jgi:hypothetical protein
MNVTVHTFVEHRSSSHQGVVAQTTGPEFLPLPGASSCCGSGCSSSSSCCCSW